MPRNKRTLPAFSKPFPRRIVAYLDILGWTELTLAGDDARLFTTLVFAESSGIQFADGQLNAWEHVRRSMFSDSIAYSAVCLPKLPRGSCSR